MFFYCLRNYFNSKCSLEKVGGCPSWGGLEQHQAFRGGSSIRRQEHGGQLAIEETDIYSFETSLLMYACKPSFVNLFGNA